MIRMRLTKPVAPATTRQPARIALVTLLLGTFCIAFSPIFVRLSEVGPTATAFYRMLFALPVLVAWTGLAGRRSGPEQRRPSGIGQYARLMAAGLFFAGDLAVWHWSIQFTSVANATVFVNFAPIFVTLGAWFLFGSRVTRTFLLGLVIALTGVVALMSESLTLKPENLWGNILAVVAALFYASYLLAIKRLRDEFDTGTVLTWSGVATCAALLVIALASGERLIATGAYGWAILLGIAWISHVGGQGLIAYSFRFLPAAFGSVSLLMQPLLAAALAWGLLSEPLSGWQGVSGAVLLSGIVIARRGSRTA